MFNFFAQIFGYVLSFLYNIVNNYGLAMILFTVIIKLLMLPLSIKQQRSLKMNTQIQKEMEVIRFKYKNDPEKMNQAVMNLYKEKNMNPFSGCLTSILQLILLLSVFYMVRQPLTYMQKIPAETITNYTNQMQEEGKITSAGYPQIDIIRETNLIQEKNPEDENAPKTNINMNFLGLDLSKIPQQNMQDYTVYIIPVLYIISTFISMRLTTKMQEKMQGGTAKSKEEVIDITEDKPKEKEEDDNPMAAMNETNKMMTWMMPILSVSIAFIAPLGLALYWLISNVMMIIERIILDKVIKTEEEN